MSDPINDYLDRLYLPNWTSATFKFTSEWGLVVPSGMVSMYVFSQGGGWLSIDDEEPMRVIAGDHVIVTDGQSHRIKRHIDSPTESINEWLETPMLSVDGLIGTEIIYGQFSLQGLTENPLRIGLPNVIHLNHRRDRELASCVSLLDFIASEWKNPSSGSQSTMARASELVFRKTIAAEMSRSATMQCHCEASEMKQAMTDSLVGPVIRALVEKPEFPWTVPGMARLVGVSKSTFSERFRRIVGSSPLQYLTEIRMQKARRMLQENDVEIANIATLVGYESPSSFSNAFKRYQGCSPADFRKNVTQPVA